MDDAGPRLERASVPFWSAPLPELLSSLHTTVQGLACPDAAERLARNGPNSLGAPTRGHILGLLARQFASPIVLLLIGAAVLSMLVHDPVDGGIILGIVITSGLLGLWQEQKASDTVAALLEAVRLRATAIRDRCETQVLVDAIVPGDGVVLSAGASVPADCRVLSSRDLFVGEAALTGESYPAEKYEGQLAAATPLARRNNALFMATHAVSGSARALVVRTGYGTEFGSIAGRLRVRPPATEFERGVRHFGCFLVEVTLLSSRSTCTLTGRCSTLPNGHGSTRSRTTSSGAVSASCSRMAGSN
jgi:Mg2+-importing ATPase